MKRSHTAPQSLAAMSKKNISRSYSYTQLPANQARSNTTSPLNEREDPFSLQSFFPAMRATETEEWAWLKESGKTEEVDGPKVEESAAMSEKEIKLAIEAEDKMGILGISLGKYVGL